MRLGLSRSRHHHGRKAIVYVCILLALTLFYLCTCRLKPAFIECASSYANNMVNSIVNQSVTDVFSGDEFTEFSEIKTGDAIKTIETDTAKINRLKAQLNESIQSHAENCQPETISNKDSCVQ